MLSLTVRRSRGPSQAGGKRTPKLGFLARSLEYGGAQRQLVALARGLHRRGREVVVVLFYPGGSLEQELRDAGVPVQVVGKRGRWDTVAFTYRLHQLLRREQLEVLHSYLDLPNLVALAVRPFLPGVRLVWGIRASGMELQGYDWLIRISSRLVFWLTRFPDLIIVNSVAGRDHYCARGVPAGRLRVIPNGIDTECFAPDPGARRRVRGEWGIHGDEMLIGVVGRLDPMKDHATFLRAAALVAQTNARVRFVCVGDGPAPLREGLERLARNLRLGDRLLWVGARSDMAEVYNALDLLCSSSAYGEGFPNVIGEAMACGVPCVVTNVGDSARIVGKSGVVVSPRDPTALAVSLEGMLRVATDGSRRCAARNSIVEHFSLEKLLDRTEEALWATV